MPADPARHFDVLGAVLSAGGLVLIVMGILASDDNLWLMLGLVVAGALVLMGFFLTVRHKERAGEEPLLSTALFRNRTSNLGLVTQNTQWLLLIGVSFVVAAYLQTVRGYDAIETGVIFTAATAGLLISSIAAERLAKRFPQRTLILTGFIVTLVGIAVLLAIVTGSPSAWAFAPGLLLIGLGLGAMLAGLAVQDDDVDPARWITVHPQTGDALGGLGQAGCSAPVSIGAAGTRSASESSWRWHLSSKRAEP